MPVAGIIGLVIGLLAALGGVFVAIFATGRFEYLGGKKKSPIAPLSRSALMQQILDLNSPDLPYQIRSSPETDLEIEWKIADARWYGIFAKESLKKTYRACMVLDEGRHAVRYWELLANVEWVAGAPKVHFQKEFIRGRIISQKSYGVQYAVKENGKFGKGYEYSFDINAIRGPIRDKVRASGWEFVEVLRKKHAMKESMTPPPSSLSQ